VNVLRLQAARAVSTKPFIGYQHSDGRLRETAICRRLV
jgi:hypothetical protein